MKSVIFILIVISLGFTDCRNQTSETKPNINSISDTRSENRAKLLDHSEKDRGKKPASRANIGDSGRFKYIGCWASYNESFMKITNDSLQTRNSYKPLSYRDISEKGDLKKDEFLIEIFDKDESREFNFPILKIEMLPNDEMDIKKYESLEALKSETFFSQMSRWVKSDCKIVEDFLKSN